MSRPASLHAENQDGDILWQTGTFRFDGAGNLIQLQGDRFNERYVYDGVSRLVQSHQWGLGDRIFADGFETGNVNAWSNGSPSLTDNYSTQSFTFDIPGNLTSITTDGQTQNHDISATTNRINGAGYDGAGNVTQYTDVDGTTIQLTYDPFNRVIKRTRGTSNTLYLYTADDERIVKFGPEGFVWTLRDLRGQLLREFRPEPDGASTNMVVQRDQVYRGSSLVGTVIKNSQGTPDVEQHYSLDHLGSPRLITDAVGHVTSEHKYYPFGEEATSSGQNDNPMKFTGHERDFNESGEADDLDYMHARYCDPSMGRFLSVDPVLGTVDNPQSWNRYAYVRGNPLRYIDPTGKEAELIVDEENKRIIVNASIDIWGDAASDEVATRFEKAIEETWSGSTFIDPESGISYQVVVDVSIRAVSTKEEATAQNRIKVVAGAPGLRDFVRTSGRVDTGRWSANKHPLIQAHEFGHLLGLPDDYKRFSGKPKSGHAGHLMAGDPDGKAWTLMPHEVQDAFEKPFGRFMSQTNRRPARVH